ncbi:transposase [Salinibacter altiplanensis]|uniref:transposase n=1 Tax=Salinibacter altiplanensis TaxID=1803181 RepID=UPI000C9F675F
MRLRLWQGHGPSSVRSVPICVKSPYAILSHEEAVTHWLLWVAQPEEGEAGFNPLPKRWVIERTFGWFGGYRRLIRDYERLPEMPEAVVRAAMIRLMIRRVT